MLAVNDEGTAFESGNVLPFRTFLVASSGARRYLINFSDDESISIKDNDNDGEGNNGGLSIYVEGTTLVVKSDNATELPIYLPNGAMQVRLRVTTGIIRHTLPQGIYIINGKKFVCQ